MHVSTDEPFQIVYALFSHQFLGYLFESFVIQLDNEGKMTLKYQNISSKNAPDFAKRLNTTDFELISLMDSIQPDVVATRFASKKMTTDDFFLKIYDKDSGNSALQQLIYEYVEQRRSKILDKIKNKLLFVMGNDGNPTYKHIKIEREPASVLFHFRRNEESTIYFPTIKHQLQKIDFQFKNAILICHQPAWLLLNDRLYYFKKQVDGHKIKPFLNKYNILIPRKIEKTYFEKFVMPLVESFDVSAKGFDIRNFFAEPEAVLRFTDGIFEEQTEMISFELSFKYEDFSVAADYKNVSVHLESIGEEYTFYKIIRDNNKEKIFTEVLQNRALPLENGRAVLEKGAAFSWIQQHRDQLIAIGFTIEQNNPQGKKYFIGKAMLNLRAEENKDWFDIYASIYFGDFEIPFLKLRKLILAGKKEFELPNGEIAVIPDEWFTQYADIFSILEESKDNRLSKHHLSLLQDLHDNNYAQVRMSRKLEKLRDFEQIEDFEMPKAFYGTLRPYQKAGYNWLKFLNEYRFGGFLADDMGLGKTVQTLALLQDQKEKGVKEASLLVMPTSLLYNWEMEAAKFTPQLKVLNYTGTHRNKDIKIFEQYDIILTSYGIVRMDLDLLKSYRFHYIILDESQAIKNPSSNITQAVKELNSSFRLLLTGTPIENSTTDLWSQMSFANPGLLGNLSFFKNFYQSAIEKKKDEQTINRLNVLIKPFILRREKSQVAKDLPEKIEHIKYCYMSPLQEKLYEEVKSYFRNQILEQIEEKGVQHSQMIILQGLIKLRQIANHPLLVEEDFAEDSGKMRDVLHALESALSNHHKILVFSQFVKHLNIFRKALDQRQIAYTYLDGGVKDRQQQVEKFQADKNISVFLISLKAGGVGLNLTAADYVFILDPWWNPAVEAQAIDRAHRIGQDKTVFIYKFITKDTVEEKILALQKQKIQLAHELISTEEGFMKNLSKQDIVELLA